MSSRAMESCVRCLADVSFLVASESTRVVGSLRGSAAILSGWFIVYDDALAHPVGEITIDRDCVLVFCSALGSALAHPEGVVSSNGDCVCELSCVFELVLN
jgi:hypothetical protein